MKRIEYWKHVQSANRPWATLILVPMQIIEEDGFFDERLKMVKEAGFSYRIIEKTEKILEESGT